jgi:hypothetical protein
MSKEDLFNVAISKMINYDKMTSQQKKQSDNPYIKPIFIQLKNGSNMKIPGWIQHKALVQWTSRKKQANGTALDNQSKQNYSVDYSGMDDDINNSDTNNDVTDSAVYNELPRVTAMNHEQLHNKCRKMHENRIGNVQVPDDRYGKGGSGGDLPRDFEIFNEQQTHDVDDFPDNRNNTRRGRIVPDEYYSGAIGNSIKLQTLNNSRMQKNIGVKGGPRDNTYDDVSVIGVDGMIGPEENVMSTPGEEFASVEDEESNSHECKSCTNQDDTYINTYDEYNDSNFDVAYTNDEEEHGEEINNKPADAKNEGTDNMYKYLFFLSLLVLIYLIYNRQ